MFVYVDVFVDVGVYYVTVAAHDDEENGEIECGVDEFDHEEVVVEVSHFVDEDQCQAGSSTYRCEFQKRNICIDYNTRFFGKISVYKKLDLPNPNN